MSEDNSRNHDSSATHQRLQHSTTLNRRYVTRPEPMIQREQPDTRVEVKIAGLDDASQLESPDKSESPETTAAIAISSFAQCQAENLRRRQELADKINKERALAMQSKSVRRGYVATEPAQPSPAKSIQVIAIDDEPARDWGIEEEDWNDDELMEEMVLPTQHTQDAEYNQETQNTQYTQSTQDTQYAQDAQNAQDVQATQNIQDAQYAQNTQDTQYAQSIQEPEIPPAPELPMQRAANARLAQTWPETNAVQHPTAQELKDAAIRKAMHSVATMEAAEQKSERQKQRKHERRRMRVGSRKRIALAIVCAVAVVGGIGYFVATNMPSVSYGAMAMQSGIDLSGMWVPRDFSLITSSAGEGSLSVVYAKGEDQFSLSAELSTWDSQTLLSNYVTKTWRGYDTVKEQGKTIYISGSNAAWVSGGVRYILEAKSGTLTNKQIKTIATSL